jgi:hypothetical protein
MEKMQKQLEIGEEAVKTVDNNGEADANDWRSRGGKKSYKVKKIMKNKVMQKNC